MDALKKEGTVWMTGKPRWKNKIREWETQSE